MSDDDLTEAKTDGQVDSAEQPRADAPMTSLQTAAESPTNDEVAGLRDLIHALEESNRISAERERVIDRLYEENQRLRAGELQQALMPLLRDLMRLYDDLEKTATAYSSRSSLDPKDVVRDWALYRDSILDILFRQGVEPCLVTEGVMFDPKEHRACNTVPTGTSSLDRTIARVIRPGFRNDTRLLRPVDVEVYRAVSEPEAVSTKE